MNVNVGGLIRRERQRQGLSLRELARRVGVSASMLSQVETDRTRPSVSTIYAIATELGISIDALLSDAGAADAAAADAADAGAMATPGQPGGAAAMITGGAAASRHVAGVGPGGAVSLGELGCQLVKPEDRRKLELESGVTWELLSDLLPHLVDFMYVSYEPGGRSSSSGKLMRHTGTEFAYLLRGKLKIQVGFDEYVLQAGDALAFDSSEPHLLVNEGAEPAEGIWFVLGRRLTPESHAARVAMPAERPLRVLHRGTPHDPA
jgi:transcriptional regulator with XRE-family HTH domain/quercetin dioxygenase-like cupin family protein